MTGHLGYESTGLNALRGQNNVQGLNDAGANPAYLPGYQPVDDPAISAKFSEAWGLDVPSNPGFRLDQMMSGLHDGRIKALYLIGENPVQTEPNAHHVEEGMEKLDFVVAQDLFLNDSNRKYANVIFPASSFAEKDGTFTNTERRVNRVRRAVPCPGNAREDFRIVVEMAEALGANWPTYESAEDAWDEFADLAPLWSGIRYDRIEEVGLQWPCTDRDHPGSPYLHAPHPSRPNGKGKFYPVEYQPPIEQPDSEYPFVLSTGRTLYHYNSATMTMREDGVVQKQEDPFVEMHPEDAVALGIEDGEWVRLVSRRGELEAKAKLGERVYPGLVWMALHFAEAKVNWLTHDVGDPLIGTPEYKTSAVRVEPIGGAGQAGRPLSVVDEQPTATHPSSSDAEEFRRLGHDVVDGIADFLRTLPERRVAPGETADEIRAALGRGGLPEHGTPAGRAPRRRPPACSSSTRPSTGIRASSPTSRLRPRPSARSATSSPPP